MMKENEMRALALAVIKKDNKILVTPGHDDIKNEDFYRLPGGGIDFGETSQQALEREMQEEFGAKITNLKLVKVIENLFTYNKWAGHEICFVYTADFIDQDLYKKEALPILDIEGGYASIWVDIDKLNRLYPEGSLNY